MAKKKAAAPAVEEAGITIGANGKVDSTNSKTDSSNTTPQHPGLCISRNKHWRFISAYHGPWLQLPHEILETLAHSNYLSPRPRQTDPGVLFDLLKIRKLVDDASDLAVRAQNGTAASALSNDNGFGISTKSGANAKLSPERKYRMRELATQKLSQAYRLDEVAASVATMQSGSSIDSVASHVLQRAPGNMDAKYVHFFHDKIPSRMMAECTTLTPLDEIIAYEPGHAAPLRTRALTKIFKDDQLGAIQDLTEALALCRMEQAKHVLGKNQLVTMKAAREEAEKRRLWSKDWMHENKVADDAQPRGLELHLLFQRANLYLTVACRYIKIALEQFRIAQRNQQKAQKDELPDGEAAPPVMSSEEMEAYRRGLEAREMVRKNAKRALRDYTAFFASLDYAFAPADAVEDGGFLPNQDGDHGKPHLQHGLQDDGSSSTALARMAQQSHQQRDGYKHGDDKWATLPLPTVHDIATVLSASPPADLPAFPTPLSNAVASRSATSAPLPFAPSHIEMVTYHPLLPEGLHSFLLIHCLLQTPPTTLLRLANNVARVARLAEGYPFFLAARSPARADWSEVLRKTKNWIGLSKSWEALCRPPSPSDEEPLAYSDGHSHASTNSLVKNQSNKAKNDKTHSEDHKRDLIHKEAVIEALGDERVVDASTFQQAVSAREKRAWRDIEDAEHSPTCADSPTSKTTMISEAALKNKIGEDTFTTMRKNANGNVAKDEEYLIGTERADAVARWVLEAPVVIDGAVGGVARRKKKKGGASRSKKTESADTAEPANKEEGLESGVQGLQLDREEDAS